MDQQLREIIRERDHVRLAIQYALLNQDHRGASFISGYEVGLNRAIAMLGGDPALVDPEMEAILRKSVDQRREAGHSPLSHR